MEITKEQQEIIDFTHAEFRKHSSEDQAKMYEVLRVVAMLKWPGHDFGISFLDITSHRYGKTVQRQPQAKS